MDQLKFAQDIENKSKNQINHLKDIYDDLFYVDNNGNKYLKPDVTIDKLKYIKDSLIEINDIYMKRAQEQALINSEKKELFNSMLQTRHELKLFSNKYNVTLPKFLSKLYDIE